MLRDVRPNWARWYWPAAAAVVWTVLILLACWLPTRKMPIPDAEVARFRIPHLDKVVHFVMFAGFGILWLRTPRLRGRPTIVLVAGVALAILTELVQGLKIVGRDATVGDAIADTVGVVAALLVSGISQRIRLPWAGNRPLAKTPEAP